MKKMILIAVIAAALIPVASGISSLVNNRVRGIVELPEVIITPNADEIAATVELPEVIITPSFS